MGSRLKYSSDSECIVDDKCAPHGGCYLSRLGICVLALVFVISLTIVGLLVHFAGKDGHRSRKLNTGRQLSHGATYGGLSYEQCQTWSNSGRLSPHTEKTLVSTSWLSTLVSGQLQATIETRILDTSTSSDNNDEELYNQDHIPNALFFDHFRCVNTSLMFPRNLPDPGCFEKYLQGLGIHGNTHVIVYDRYQRRPSARAWWLLRLYGHKRVSILDGGYKKWKQDGFQTSDVLPNVQASDMQIDFNPILYRDFQAMSLNLESKIEQVIDARSEDYFTGKITEHGLIPGHIPGSINVPFTDMFNNDETFKSPEELRKLFTDSGIHLDRPVVATCATAMKATATAVAFHLLGKIIPVYHGSWTEWSQRVTQDKIATGRESVVP